MTMFGYTLIHLVVTLSLISLMWASKCEFSVDGIALEGHTFESFHAENIHICYTKCKEKIGCHSINFYPESSNCELNNRTLTAKPERKVLNSKAVHFKKTQRAIVGSHKDIPGESCLEIKNSTNTLLSGLYWVKHAYKNQAERTYCNMATGAADHCASSPCQNQGTCQHINETHYRCTCASPYRGINCELHDVCTSSSCQNGGTCVPGASGAYTCSCTANFIGIKCDTVKDSMCSSYTNLTDGTRNVLYVNPVDKCDKNIVVRWYRFTGPAGVRMPTTCVAKNHCNTDASGWLSQTPPTAAQGVVSRKVCFHWDNDCCKWNKMIKVRNCGAFYVYELHPTPNCQLRYCGTN